ncbi:forkhead box protein L3 [Pectinophora gossypiella]|uniref:forkhead box protein L3 n=1 Tax=Pectinophora gossypiella TaxID=13191 RepID=UPI00214E4882|nr:forkhead box protein L3 [Pectinophora gossypiella]
MCSGPDGGPWPLKDAPAVTAAALDHYRLQLYNYAVAERLRLYPPAVAPCYPYAPRLALSMSLLQQRALQPEEPKPQHSYIGLIAMAILSSPERKLVLSDIYQHILDNYPYFRTRGPGWRNSIRHNLSLNDCFVKAGRSANGKGHYWAIHPANIEDFRKGDFRRRKAQRKVRKHMGLAVDDDGEDSPSPPPASPPPTALPLPFWGAGRLAGAGQPRKRQFDVASLLAPDEAPEKRTRRESSCEEEPEEDIDVVASDAEEEPRPAAHYPLLGGWWPALEPALLQQLRRAHPAAAALPAAAHLAPQLAPHAPHSPHSPHDTQRPPDT